MGLCLYIKVILTYVIWCNKLTLTHVCPLFEYLLFRSCLFLLSSQELVLLKTYFKDCPDITYSRPSPFPVLWMTFFCCRETNDHLLNENVEAFGRGRVGWEWGQRSEWRTTKKKGRLWAHSARAHCQSGKLLFPMCRDLTVGRPESFTFFLSTLKYCKRGILPCSPLLWEFCPLSFYIIMLLVSHELNSALIQIMSYFQMVIC